jgi:hypothetical protein
MMRPSETADRRRWCKPEPAPVLPDVRYLWSAAEFNTRGEPATRRRAQWSHDQRTSAG